VGNDKAAGRDSKTADSYLESRPAAGNCRRAVSC